MSAGRLSPEFLRLVDEMTTPQPEPSETVRVAGFHFGDSLAPAVEAAGMEVVADLDARTEIPDFDVMSEFDLVVADASSAETYSSIVRYLVRFLFVRRPPAFVVVGCTDETFRLALAGASAPYGYEVSLGRQDGVEFTYGINEREDEDEIWEKVEAVMRGSGGRE